MAMRGVSGGELWRRLLWCAQFINQTELGVVLESVRQRGAIVSCVDATGRLKLCQSQMPAAEWEAAKRDELAPHRDQLIGLLEYAQLGGIAWRADVLGGAVIIITEQADWVTDPALRSVTYTVAELKALRGRSPDEVRAWHEAKAALGGGTIIRRADMWTTGVA